MLVAGNHNGDSSVWAMLVMVAVMEIAVVVGVVTM